MGRLAGGLLAIAVGWFLTAAPAALAQVCPGTITACPSPTYNGLTAQSLTTNTLTANGATTLSGGGAFSGTFSGNHTYSGDVTFSGSGTGLSVTNTAQAGTLTSLGDVNVANGSHLWLVPSSIGLTWNGSAIVANSQVTANRLNGGASNAITPSSSAIGPVIYGQVGAFSGTVVGQADITRISVSSDNANCTSASNGLCDDLGIYTNVGGSSVTGGRANIWGQISVGSGIATTGLEMIGISETISSSTANDGAYLQPIASSINLSGTANNTGGIGNEFDYAATSASGPGYKMGLLIGLSTGDSVAGTSNDAGLDLFNANLAGTSPGMSYGIMFGETGQGFPISSTGTIIGMPTETAFKGFGQNGQFIAPQAANGVDFHNIYFTAKAYSSAGFSVTGADVLNLGQLTITPSTSGVSFDTPREILSGTPTVSNGGTGSGGIGCYYAGDIVGDTYGDQLSVATVSGCQAATFSVLTRGTTASPPGSPVAMTGGSGSGLTATLTFAAAATLNLGTTTAAVSIGNSSAAITFGGAITLASSTTGSGTQTYVNSPCSTSLTNEQWIPVKITGQTGTWYIPACH